jgi:hypothetical protein
LTCENRAGTLAPVIVSRQSKGSPHGVPFEKLRTVTALSLVVGIYAVRPLGDTAAGTHTTSAIDWRRRGVRLQRARMRVPLKLARPWGLRPAVGRAGAVAA